jgi:hypothetical protein
MSTTKLAFQLLAASNYIDALGGVSQSYRQALASYEAEAEAKPADEPVAWAISYDGKTPYALWDYGEGALLDLEVKRLGGTASKMPLYAAPVAPALTDEELFKIAQSMPQQPWGIGSRHCDAIAYARAVIAAITTNKKEKL